jgi:membrane-bound ClpP family serine protease
MNVIKNSTFYIALLLGLVGIILYIVEIFYPIIPYLGLIGFILLVVAWLLFILGVRTTGL